MANGETVDRILRAATILFAERGFTETSLRTITAMADVNLAAVNYHFGNKKALMQAVFSQFLTPFCRELDKRLNEMEANLTPGQLPQTEQLLQILFDSLTCSVASINEKPQRLMRLLSLAYTQSQEHIRGYLTHAFGSTYKRYLNWLKKIRPELDPMVLYWRIHFLLGAAIFTMGSFESIQAILKAEYKVETEMEQAMAYLVEGLSGLLNTRATPYTNT
jgi:AcrR family transcriptional regulator